VSQQDLSSFVYKSTEYRIPFPILENNLPRRYYGRFRERFIRHPSRKQVPSSYDLAAKSMVPCYKGLGIPNENILFA
jgi:hypothetical protein